MNMNNDQVRESSNSIHNFLLISFMSVLKASTLGHKYVKNKGLRNYYIEENKDKSKLYEHDCTISDGKDNLKIEMKTKQANGLNLQYLKENALLRTSHLLFKDSRFLLVVAVYSKELRYQYNQGDMLGFLNQVKFIMAYGQGYSHKWTELKPLNYWGPIIRSADNIDSFFNLISKENTKPTPPPLVLMPSTIKAIKKEKPVQPHKTKRKTPTPSSSMDELIKKSKELYDRYGFSKSVIASILGICNSNLSRGDLLEIKSNQTRLTYIFCYMLKCLSLLKTGQTTSIKDIHAILDQFVNRRFQIKEARALINSALKDGFIRLTDGYRWLDNVDAIRDNQYLKLELQQKLHILVETDLFKEKLKAHHDNNT